MKKNGKRNEKENNSLMTCRIILSSLRHVPWIQELENNYRGVKKF